jgi:hypothetical protein
MLSASYSIVIVTWGKRRSTSQNDYVSMQLA